MKAGKVALDQLRVLAVEDDPDSLDLLAFILQEHGAEVATAASASQALELFAQFQPEVLILDIAMPKVDGCMLLCQIRNLQAVDLTPIPAIALSAMAGYEQRNAAMATGFQAYLTKPCDFEQLITVVAQLCGRI